MQRARKIIAVSHFTKWELTNYYKIPANKIQVIHNGVDIKKFQPAADKRKVKAELGFNPDDLAIVSVGRLYARKGFFTLIESMPAVIKRFPNAKFIISGKGQSDEMHKLIAHAEQTRRKRQHYLHRLLSRQETAKTLPSRRRLCLHHLL